MRPVTKQRLGELSGNDRTLAVERKVMVWWCVRSGLRAHGTVSAPTRQVIALLRLVSVFDRWREVTVGDRAVTVERRGPHGRPGVTGHWSVHQVVWTCASGHVGFCLVKGSTTILAVGAINRSMASLRQQCWAPLSLGVLCRCVWMSSNSLVLARVRSNCEWVWF
jgi:hypothetical protein